MRTRRSHLLRIECYADQEIAQSAHLFNEAFLYYRPFSPQTSVGQMRWLMRNSWVDPDLLLCAKINETIVGQVLVLPREVNVAGSLSRVGVVSQVAVHPDWRRRGIGKALMERAAALATDRDYDGLLLTANPGSPAHDLYRKLGYRTLVRMRLMIRILDSSMLSRALNARYLLPLLQLLSRQYQIDLPPGIVVRSYGVADLEHALALLKSHIETRECAEEIDEQFWIWKQETLQLGGRRRCFVAEEDDRIVAFVSAAPMIAMAQMGRKKTRTRVCILEDLCYEEGMRSHLRAFLGEVLRKLLISHPVAAIHLAYPDERRLWKNLRLYGMPLQGMERMVLSLKPSLSRLFQARSFYFSRF